MSHQQVHPNLKKQIYPVKLKTYLELDGEFGGVRRVLSTPSCPAVGRAAGVEVASGASAWWALHILRDSLDE